MLKVGINGFGRVGRLACRTILQKYQHLLDLVCINTSGKVDPASWAHLFKYDSCYGQYPGEVKADEGKMMVDGKIIPIFGEKDPSKINWSKYATQVVIDSTGIFLKVADLKQHLQGTVKKVVVAAPPKDEKIKMVVLGVNDEVIKTEKIVSCASCTTNCVAPVVKVIEENFGIKKGLMSTVHAYTSDQELLDGSHKDLRRARAAAVNIVPTTTGAAKATAKVYPQVKGIFDGLALRVPVITGSLTDFTFVTKKKTTVEAVNEAFIKASQQELKGILGVTKEPLVSSDIIGLSFSALVDLLLTMVVDEDLVKVIAWYDNEWGYVQRLVEEVLLMGNMV